LPAPGKEKPGTACNGTGQKGTEMTDTQSHERAQARRRDILVCTSCGTTATRRSNKQKFCSDRCKEIGRTRCRKTFLGTGTGAPTIAQKKPNDFSDLQGPNFRSSVRVSPDLWRNVIETEFFAGRKWAKTVSADGVTCSIARFVPRALRS
jgi:hypothetical protein